MAFTCGQHGWARLLDSDGLGRFHRQLEIRGDLRLLVSVLSILLPCVFSSFRRLLETGRSVDRSKPGAGEVHGRDHRVLSPPWACLERQQEAQTGTAGHRHLVCRWCCGAVDCDRHVQIPVLMR